MNTCTVLLVDDERSFIETIAERLRLRGMTVACAFSGDEAVRQLAENKEIDVVFLDVKMPGRDGIDVLEEIKRHYPLIEVVMLTGHATVHSAIEALHLGAFDYLTKPCAIEQLIDKAEQASLRKKMREDRIRDIRTKPYITEQERDELIARVLKKPPVQNS